MRAAFVTALTEHHGKHCVGDYSSPYKASEDDTAPPVLLLGQRVRPEATAMVAGRTSANAAWRTKHGSGPAWRWVVERRLPAVNQFVRLRVRPTSGDSPRRLSSRA